MEPNPALAAIKTYNYLRIALAALVLLLFVSVALEWWTADGCLQPSISAYYFTPVRAVFIGVLVTMGVCLVALKGNTDGEDVLMNLAGMLAPGVAFIPTGASGRCGASEAGLDVPAGVANNMPALFVTGLVVGAVTLVIARREAGGLSLSTPNRLGLGLTVLVLGSGVVWFVVARDSFLDRGHDAAAIPMFLAVIAVVWLNGRDVQLAVAEGAAPSTRARYVPVYRGIAIGMLVALAVTVAISLLTGSTSLVLWVEVVLIALFAAFWVVQTVELWDRGLRAS
jgi:hypothetical protein